MLFVLVVIGGPGKLTMVALLLFDIVPAMVPFLTVVGSDGAQVKIQKNISSLFVLNEGRRGDNAR